MYQKSPLTVNMVEPRVLSPYDEMILGMAQKNGGFNNAHGHADRSDTIDGIYLAHINANPLVVANQPLRVKQSMVGYLHTGVGYTEKNLRERISRLFERLIAYGTTRFATCIDVSPDIAENGQLAFRIAKELQQTFANRIRIEICPSPIFGFKEGSGRWEVFQEAAKTADFLSCLPEKDDFVSESTRDGRVGFRKHIRMVMELACKLKKEVHLHLDQANDPNESGTETLIEGLRWLDQPQIPNHPGPAVWVIHMISPSGYSEERFSRLIDDLLKHRLGVIICPTAAISMRHLRPLTAPVHASIARLLELCKKGVPVQLGTDNICDFFVPQSDGDMLTEMKMGGHAVRFAIPHIWAKLAAGIPLNEVDKTDIGGALYQDSKAFLAIEPNWTPAVD